LQPDTVGYDTLKLYQNNHLIFTEIFQLKRIEAEFKPQLGEIKDNKARVPEILRDTKIKVIIPNSICRHTMKVVFFECLLLNEKGKVFYSIHERSNQLPKKLIRKIRMLKEGDIILLQGIGANCPDCTTRVLADIRLTIIK
jgi:hypothetical protein